MWKYWWRIREKNLGNFCCKIVAQQRYLWNYTFFFCQILGVGQMKIFKCEDIVMSTSYFISEHFKIIRKHRKKLVDVRTNGTNRKLQKKISWIFWQIFLILHGLQSACCTLWNVIILLKNVVYDANNKFWQYWYVANKIRNFLFMMKIFKKCSKTCCFTTGIEKSIFLNKMCAWCSTIKFYLQIR